MKTKDKIGVKNTKNRKMVVNKNHKYKIHKLTMDEIRKGRSNAYKYAL